MRQTQTLRRGPESLESLDQAPPPADTSKPHPLFLLPSTTGAQGCWSHPRWMVSIIRNRAPPVHFLATVARADDQYAGSAPHICCSGAGGRRLVIMAAADVLFTRRREAKRQQRGLRLCFNLFLFLMHLSLLFPSLSHLHGVCALQSHTHGWVCDFQRGGARKRAFKVMSVKVKVILDGCRLTSEGYRIWWGLSPVAAASAWTSHTLTFGFWAFLTAQRETSCKHPCSASTHGTAESWQTTFQQAWRHKRIQKCRQRPPWAFRDEQLVPCDLWGNPLIIPEEKTSETRVGTPESKAQENTGSLWTSFFRVLSASSVVCYGASK